MFDLRLYVSPAAAAIVCSLINAIFAAQTVRAADFDVKVRPEKILYAPGDFVTARLTLANTTDRGEE